MVSLHGAFSIVLHLGAALHMMFTGVPNLYTLFKVNGLTILTDGKNGLGLILFLKIFIFCRNELS